MSFKYFTYFIYILFKSIYVVESLIYKYLLMITTIIEINKNNMKFKRFTFTEK